MADERQNQQEGQQEGQQQEIGIREQLLAVLLEHIEEDPYPSTTQMDLAEELLTPRTAPVYARVLMQKIRNDTFPSNDLIQRVLALA